MFKVTCSCGYYTAEFDFQEIAETASNMHVMLGKDHVITCTRPAHFHSGSVPVIVFTCKHQEGEE